MHALPQIKRRMATLNIKLHGIPDRSKASRLSICIQLNNESAHVTTAQSHANRKALAQHYIASVTPTRKESRHTRKVEISQSKDRLLPTDKLVLYALHSRVALGEAVTPPVRVRELAEECSISRKQVQICLKRLGEKRLISRITKGVTVGSQEGYRYRILQGTKKAISSGE